MPTLESIGASIEGLTAGSYEPRDLAIYVLVWLSVEVPGEALICRARFYPHLHRRGQKPCQGPRPAYGRPPGAEERGHTAGRAEGATLARTRPTRSTRARLSVSRRRSPIRSTGRRAGPARACSPAAPRSARTCKAFPWGCPCPAEREEPELAGDREFESFSLQRRVRNEPDTAAEIAEISRVQFRQAGRDEYPRRRARYGAPHREYPTPMPQGANGSPISSAS